MQSQPFFDMHGRVVGADPYFGTLYSSAAPVFVYSPQSEFSVGSQATFPIGPKGISSIGPQGIIPAYPAVVKPSLSRDPAVVLAAPRSPEPSASTGDDDVARLVRDLLGREDPGRGGGSGGNSISVGGSRKCAVGGDGMALQSKRTPKAMTIYDTRSHDGKASRIDGEAIVAKSKHVNRGREHAQTKSAQTKDNKSHTVAKTDKGDEGKVDMAKDAVDGVRDAVKRTKKADGDAKDDASKAKGHGMTKEDEEWVGTKGINNEGPTPHRLPAPVCEQPRVVRQLPAPRKSYGALGTRRAPSSRGGNVPQSKDAHARGKDGHAPAAIRQQATALHAADSGPPTTPPAAAPAAVDPISPSTPRAAAPGLPPTPWTSGPVPAQYRSVTEPLAWRAGSDKGGGRPTGDDRRQITYGGRKGGDGGRQDVQRVVSEADERAGPWVARRIAMEGARVVSEAGLGGRTPGGSGGGTTGGLGGKAHNRGFLDACGRASSDTGKRAPLDPGCRKAWSVSDRLAASINDRLASSVSDRLIPGGTSERFASYSSTRKSSDAGMQSGTAEDGRHDDHRTVSESYWRTAHNSPRQTAYDSQRGTTYNGVPATTSDGLPLGTYEDVAHATGFIGAADGISHAHDNRRVVSASERGARHVHFDDVQRIVSEGGPRVSVAGLQRRLSLSNVADGHATVKREGSTKKTAMDELAYREIMRAALGDDWDAQRQAHGGSDAGHPAKERGKSPHERSSRRFRRSANCPEKQAKDEIPHIPFGAPCATVITSPIYQSASELGQVSAPQILYTSPPSKSQDRTANVLALQAQAVAMSQPGLLRVPVGDWKWLTAQNNYMR
ncbi:hypothetical protein BD626DRAFT_483750 [Schizophyllum amplum]|uniref:Uncharacterized protein n=1 Tax=Schizophyllum amplum TaxID=97359 RepID=A0A550CPP0_9AGAR|nr:hypothetical protein BD626DRAFT_483750 [Auriculariopsis ampla]